MCASRGFNEAAGFTRRKRHTFRSPLGAVLTASMRPPDLPGGNPSAISCVFTRPMPRFNEAAGFTRRKLSMRTFVPIASFGGLQ